MFKYKLYYYKVVTNKEHCKFKIKKNINKIEIPKGWKDKMNTATQHSSGTGTIDDILANDPAHERLSETSEQARQMTTALEPHLKSLIGQPANNALASSVIKILYEAPKGEVPILAKLLAGYGIHSTDYQTLVATYGISREDLTRDLVKPGENFGAGDILRLAQTLAARYHAKTMEAEPARLGNLAHQHGVKPVLANMLSSVKKMYGEAAAKAERIRQAGVTSVQDLAGYTQQFYGGPFDRYSQAAQR